MIAVIGHIDVALEAAPALRRLAEEVQLATRAEPGCRQYAFGIDLARQERLWLSELWTDGEDLERHFTTPHFLAFRAAIRQLPGLVVEVFQYDAINARDLVSRQPA
jgi:quinol monooxygenase YgiN